ncbi:uncharacterized protein C10orf143 homolog [Pelodytes ibericus]
MNICEDMDLQLSNMKKRECMGDILEHPNSKRQCLDLDNIANGNGLLFNQLNECKMVCLQMQISKEQSMQEMVPKPENHTHFGNMPFGNDQTKSCTQACPRCMAGESGHLRHVLGF